MVNKLLIFSFGFLFASLISFSLAFATEVNDQRVSVRLDPEKSLQDTERMLENAKSSKKGLIDKINEKNGF